MLVSDAIIKCLELEKVDTVFGYPGGAVIPIYESLRKSDIKHVLVRHEQSATHASSGYSRASGRVGVCIATSGPGATNLITGIATAYMDSIPLVIITGQVNSCDIGKDVFQEADIIGSTSSFTKHNYLVEDEKDIQRIMKEAFYIARTGRPGPVLIDIPVDIQKRSVKFSYPSNVDIAGYKPTYIGHAGQIKRSYKLIRQSKRPVICVGGGIISSNASKELRLFSSATGIPIIHTLMGIGAVSRDFENYYGMVGSHGHSHANEILKMADLIIVIGARIGDRATQGFKLIGSEQKIIHIDIDPAEVGKNVNTVLPVVGDARSILESLASVSEKMDIEDWKARISHLKKSEDDIKISGERIDPKISLEIISNHASKDAIFVADVGRNQIWAARNLDISEKRDFFTSGGLGTMGYSLPAAMGAKIASKERQVVSILGDGSFQMVIGELATIVENNADIKIILFNNNCLGMVRELQDINIGRGRYFGIEFRANPDFVKLAEAYGIDSCRVERQNEFEDVIKTVMNCDGPFLLECVIDSDIDSLV